MKPAVERHRYAFAAHAPGCLGLELCGAEVVCRPSGALWLEAARALVVADLHLEKGSSYARRGQMLPPYDTADTLTRLEAEAAILSPRVLVFLGDTLHDDAAPPPPTACGRWRWAAPLSGWPGTTTGRRRDRCPERRPRR